MQGLVVVGRALVLAIGREHVLDEVVGSEAEEIDLLRQGPGHQGRRRHLDHRAHRDVWIEALSLGGELVLHLPQHFARLSHVLDPDDHGKEDGNGMPSAHSQEGAQLRLQDVDVPEQEPDAAFGERRIPRGREWKVGEDLVAA